MKFRRLVVVLALVSGCGHLEESDAGAPIDAGATVDAGATIDAGTTIDAGATTDAGATIDAGSTIDAGATLDAGSWAEIEAMPGTWIYRARDAYTDAAQTQRVGNNDEISSFRASGTGIPSVNDVAGVANLQWLGSTDFQSPNAPVYYASFGHKPTFVDRGNGDEYVRFLNGLPTDYGTEPGSLTPALARGEDFHLVQLFRTMPGASYEGLLSALGSYKDRYGDKLYVAYNNTELFGTAGKVTRWGEDNIVEIIYRANGTIEMSLNGEVVLSGSLPGLTTMGFTEFALGTNSHITSHHFRAIVMRAGGLFTATELDTIRRVSNTLWPRGVKPNFPYLDGQFRNNWLDWKDTTKSWEPGIGTFSGGNGVAGTPLYQWYYWTDPGAGTPWPRGNCLDYHLPLPGLQGQGPTLNRADYSAGNTFGNPVIFAEPGQQKVRVMRVVTPRDSVGTLGEPLAGDWAIDQSP
jgi:hypothetical protein